jgi:hypothetical protein
MAAVLSTACSPLRGVIRIACSAGFGSARFVVHCGSYGMHSTVHRTGSDGPEGYSAFDAVPHLRFFTRRFLASSYW